MYESGFFWRRFEKSGGDGPGWDLIAPSGGVAATVFEYKNPSGHVWFVWDKDGVGGENSIDPTIEQAKISAESAVLRWGKHFTSDEHLDDYEQFMDNVDNQISETLEKIGESPWKPSVMPDRVDVACRLLEEIPALRGEIERLKGVLLDGRIGVGNHR